MSIYISDIAGNSCCVFKVWRFIDSLWSELCYDNMQIHFLFDFSTLGQNV